MGKSKKKNDELTPEAVVQRWVERDLTTAAEAGELPPAFEVDDVLRRIEDLLSAGLNPILVGESGVGKTAIIQELVRRATAGEGVACLAGRQVLEVSFRRRAAALAKPDQEMRPETQTLVDALVDLEGAVTPFIRDIHYGYRFDAESQLLSLALRAKGPLLCEGERTGIEDMFEHLPELAQHFVVIEVQEPSIEQTETILARWSEEQVTRRSTAFTPEALTEALFLTHRFLARDRLPRKAIDLLVHAASLSPAGEPVDAAHVIERFSDHHHVPRFIVDPLIPMDLAAREAEVRRVVLGQDEAVQTIVRMIGLIKAGLSDVRRPFGAFLFVGPTGVGKTHLAQVLAEQLFGSRDRVIRINLADYQSETAADTLFGNPDDSRPQFQRGVLTRRLGHHSFSVLLLDEIEKAHAKVSDRFLQLIDEGAFINGAGETVACRSTIIIATSNEGAELYRRPSIGFAETTDIESIDRAVDRQLDRRFRFEFLNRFDRVVHFHPLSREHIRTIAARELERLTARSGLRQRQLSVEVDDSVLDWLAVHGYDPDYGARFLRRAIESHATTALADAVVRHSPARGARLALRVRRGRIQATVVDEKPPAARERVTLPEGTTAAVRKLDAARLREEAAQVLQRGRPHQERLAHRRREATALLEQMNAEGFWDRADERREVLARYRELDVAIQADQRNDRACVHLAELLDAPESAPLDPSRLASSLERAAEAIQRWDEQLVDDGPSAAWLVVSNPQPLRPAEDWLVAVARMEAAWCERVGLTASAAACAQSGDTLTHVVLEVEGRGAGEYLAAEEGDHRLRQPDGDARARVLVVPRRGQGSAEAKWPGMRDMRTRGGPLDLTLTCRGTARDDGRGLALELLGGDRRTLASLLADLTTAWEKNQSQPPETARVYADGGTVRDTRTGVATGRMKGVLEGDLDRFLEGWRRRTDA